MAALQLAPFDRKRDPAEALDPRVGAGRLKAIAKPRLVRGDTLAFESQTDLARSLGVAKSTVTKWAKGQLPMSNRHVIAAAYHLNVSPFWLLGIVEDRSFDWRVPAMPAEQYERAQKVRSELASAICSISDAGKLLEEYPADYREPDQLLADAICWHAHERTGNDEHVPLIELLIHSPSHE